MLGAERTSAFHASRSGVFAYLSSPSTHPASVDRLTCEASPVGHVIGGEVHVLVGFAL
jgi:hypothetical protein